MTKERRVPKKGVIYITAALIACLLFANIFVMYENQKVINENRLIQEQTEEIKVNTLNIIRTLHQMDMGVRGYALIRSEVQLKVAKDGFIQMDSIFSNLEKNLLEQDFPPEDIRIVKDSIHWYLEIVSEMLAMINRDDLNSFNNRLKQDLGLYAYYAYVTFANKVNKLEDVIARDAQHRYKLALKVSYLLQVFLFFIIAPAIFFLVSYTNYALRISERLRSAEEKNVKLLEEQNIILERQVSERTKEILAQNAEISAQNEEIVAHNEQLIDQQEEIIRQKNSISEKSRSLEDAYKIIETQKDIIQGKNMELTTEVENQTRDLKESNLQLVDQNNRLEQFTFIISHNLRGPIARIVGLCSLLEETFSQTERNEIIKMIVRSTNDFESIFKDLSQILRIQKSNGEFRTQVSLHEVVEKVSEILREDLEAFNATIKINFAKVEAMFSLSQYVESILYNLISNAIKYRHPDRAPVIEVSSDIIKERVVIIVRDNGIGLDLSSHRENLFNLYKRFHFHVEGKGVGLFLVRTQIEALGGKIEVDSTPNVGTTFSVFF